MISTLQVVHASCLSHNPYTFIFSFTDLFVASIRLSPILRYILPYLHSSVYYIPFTPRIFIIIFLAYSPILSTLVIFFHILQSIFLIIIMITVLYAHPWNHHFFLLFVIATFLKLIPHICIKLFNRFSKVSLIFSPCTFTPPF